MSAAREIVGNLSKGCKRNVTTPDTSERCRGTVFSRDYDAEQRGRGLKGVVANADVPSRLLKDVCRLTDAAHAHLRRQVERLNLSARAYDRILRVARTAADLKGREAVTEEEVLEAAGYRALDRENGFWA